MNLQSTCIQTLLPERDRSLPSSLYSVNSTNLLGAEPKWNRVDLSIIQMSVCFTFFSPHSSFLWMRCCFLLLLPCTFPRNIACCLYCLFCNFFHPQLADHACRRETGKFHFKREHNSNIHENKNVKRFTRSMKCSRPSNSVWTLDVVRCVIMALLCNLCYYFPSE